MANVTLSGTATAGTYFSIYSGEWSGRYSSWTRISDPEGLPSGLDVIATTGSSSATATRFCVLGTVPTSEVSGAYQYTSTFQYGSTTVVVSGTITVQGGSAATGLLYFSADAGGTVSGTSPISKSVGTTFTCSNNQIWADDLKYSEATANEGFTFSGWYINGSRVTSGTFTSSDQYIVAHFTTDNITVYFSASPSGSGTTSKSSVAVPYGTSVTIDSSNRLVIDSSTITATASTGYTFSGMWSISSGTTITSSTTIYAYFNANTYTVTFNKQGGSGGDDTQTVTYKASMSSISIPSKSGMYFDGYYSQTSGGGTKYFGPTGAPLRNWNIANNTVLYAYWTSNEATVTFDANGGSPTPSSMTVTKGTSITLPGQGSMVKTGNTFNGWSSGGTNYSAGDSVQITADVKFIARWTIATYTVYFNAMGGTVSTESMSVSYGSPYGTLPTPTYTGYTFKEWDDANGDKVTSSTTYNIEGDSTLYAVWTAKTYSVSYNRNSSYATGSMSSQSVTFGTPFYLSDCTFVGNETSNCTYVFMGWARSSSATVAAYNDGEYISDDFGTSGTSTVTLYAVWYRRVDVTLASDETKGFASVSPAGGTYLELGNPATFHISATPEPGYRFKQWIKTYGSSVTFASGTTASNTYITTTTNASITAEFEELTFTVAASSNDTALGTVSPSTQTVTYGGTASGITATPTGNDYIFVRWTVTMGSSTATSQDNPLVLSNITTDCTAVATFAAGQYIVTLNDAGGSGGSGQVTAVIGEYLPSPINIPTRSGHMFKGYGTDASTLYYDETGTPVRVWNTFSNTTLYAQWEESVTITVSVSPAGAGTVTGAGAHPKNQPVTLVAVASPGYTFTVWRQGASDLNNDPIWSLPSQYLSSNQSFTAVFTPNTYTVRYNAHGGTGTMEDQSFTYGVSQTLSANAFSKAGADFLWWNTAEDGSGTIYDDEASVSNLTTVNNGVVNLYAQWSGENCTLNFAVNNSRYGSISPSATLSVPYNTIIERSGNNIVIRTSNPVTVVPTPATGCSFTGWSFTSPVRVPQTITASFSSSSSAVQVILVKGRDYNGQTVTDEYGNVLNAQLVTSPNYTVTGMTFTNETQQNGGQSQ